MRSTLMNLDEITAAVDAGKTVCWQTGEYRVVPGPSHPDAPGNAANPATRYLIKHEGGHAIGLTWSDGETLNGREVDFFVLN
jgi:hypothetical protein